MTMGKENMEWPEDGKLAELVGKANPFVVPEGYFDGLDERVMAVIKIDELRNNIPDDGFTTPAGYFDALSSVIKANIAVEESVNNKETGFALPAGYFDNLSDNIQSRIAVDAALEAGEAFEVPVGYFENLSSQILSRVFVEETFAGEEVFAVPDGYFEQLNATILNKTITQEAVQRKGGVIRLIRSTAFKYATAACFVLVAGASFLLWPAATNVEAHDSSYLHKQLSGVPIDELEGYIQLSMDGSDVQHTVGIEELPVKEASFNAGLQDYIEQ